MSRERPPRRIEGERFIKHFDANVAEEAAKCRALHALGPAAGFRAPAVLEVDEGAGTIAFERLEPLRSIRESYLAALRRDELLQSDIERFRRVGVALAAMHRDIKLPGTRPWQPPAAFASALRDRLGPAWATGVMGGAQAILHGDFGFSNVALSDGTSGEVLVVIDASPNGYATTNPLEIGPVAVDLAAFLVCLEGLVPFGDYRGCRWERVPLLRRAMLAGYAAAGGILPAPGLLAAVVEATAEAYFAIRFRNRLARWGAERVLFNRWKGNRPLDYGTP